MTVLRNCTSLGGNEVLLELQNELDDAAVSQLRQSFEKVMGEGMHLLVKLESVNFIDSTGLGFLIEMASKAREIKGDLVLVGISPYVHNILKLTGLENLFQRFSNEMEAKAHLSFPCADCAVFVGIANCPLVKSLTYAALPCQ